MKTLTIQIAACGDCPYQILVKESGWLCFRLYEVIHNSNEILPNCPLEEQPQLETGWRYGNDL